MNEYRRAVEGYRTITVCESCDALRWRDVRDELPEYRLLVLTINSYGYGGEQTGWLNEEDQWMNADTLLVVTHWLPIPSLLEGMQRR